MVNGITTFAEQLPFTVYDSTNASLQGSAPEISGFPSDRPNLVGDPNSGLTHRRSRPGRTRELVQYQCLRERRRRASSATSDGTPCWTGHPTVGFLCHQELQSIGETKTFSSAGSFSTSSTTQISSCPTTTSTSSDFGQIQAAQPGRIVQLALKFLF